MIRPLFDNVVLKKEKVCSKTTSGIVLSTKEEESKFATVVAIGNGHLPDGKVVEMPIKVGDRVFYKAYSTETIQEDNSDYLLVSLSNIVAVIE